MALSIISSKQHLPAARIRFTVITWQRINRTKSPVFITFLSLSKDFFRPCDVPSSMGARNAMSLALEKILAPAVGRPESPATDEADPRLNISVVFTAIDSTLAALKHAGAMANSLGACITLLVPQVVPYPLPLTSPPVLLDFSERRFRVMAGTSQVETRVRIYLCRDRLDTLATVLRPHSLVVIGGRKRWWWPRAEKRLANRLRRAGHEVIFSETE
jgi:hypothetical protein